MKKQNITVIVKRKIYEQVVKLAAELAKTKVAEEIYNAAKEGKTRTVQEILDEFPQKYPELNRKIVNFGEAFNMLHDVYDVRVLGYESKEEEGIFVYDKDVIDPLSFCFFTLFAKVETDDLFGRSPAILPFVNAIEKVTNNDFARFVLGYSWTDFMAEDGKMGKIVVAAVWGSGYELF